MRVLVTAGPTHEPIDPVRFIGNRSSGKMGIAIAETFAEQGHEVILVKGPTNISTSKTNIATIEVETAAQMFDACKQYFSDCDVVIFAAAVADYTPKHVSDLKIKKNEAQFSIELVKTKDIAAVLCAEKKANQTCVGFALETNNEATNAAEKLKKKNLDCIVLNSMRDKGAGFGVDTNKVTIMGHNGDYIVYDMKSKKEVAKDIVDYIERIRS